MCYLRSYGLLRPSCISHPFPLLPFPQSPILDRLIFPMSRPAWWQWPCSPPPSPLFCLQPQQQQPLYGGAGAAAPPTSSSASSSAQQYGYGGYPGGAGSGAGAPGLRLVDRPRLDSSSHLAKAKARWAARRPMGRGWGDHHLCPVQQMQTPPAMVRVLVGSRRSRSSL